MQNSHMYWNMASVRAVIPGVIDDETIAQPLEKAFSRYNPENYELVIGAAEAVDTAAKTVKISAAGGDRSLVYDQLVLATGARCAVAGMPWKAAGSHEEVMAALHAIQDRVAGAGAIAIAGAGATGVELAGELGFALGREKEITLLAGGGGVLGGDAIAGSASSELDRLNVRVRAGATVETTRELDDGRTEIELHGGERIVVDLYLPTMGLVPNSDYLDATLLNNRKYVNVDERFRVRGADDVWALGDVVSVPRAGYVFTQKQVSRLVWRQTMISLLPMG